MEESAGSEGGSQGAIALAQAPDLEQAGKDQGGILVVVGEDDDEEGYGPHYTAVHRLRSEERV